MIQLDHLPHKHPLRNTPLAEIGAKYRWIYSKGNPRTVLRAFAIGGNTFNELRGSWLTEYVWFCEDLPEAG